MKVYQTLKQHRLANCLFRISLASCLWIGQGMIAIGQSQPSISKPATMRIHQGLDYYQRGQLVAAIQVWRTVFDDSVVMTPAERVGVQKYLARALAQIGQSEAAIALFKQLQHHYQQVGDSIQVGRMLTEQAQLYDTLGQHQKAVSLLCQEPERATVGTGQTSEQLGCRADSAIAIARQTADFTGLIAALGSLGNTHRLQGDYDSALYYLTESLNLTQQRGYVRHQLAIFNNLGNTYASLAKRDYRRQQFAVQAGDTATANRFQQQAIALDQQAIHAFQRSHAQSQQQGDRVNAVRSLLNLVLSLHRVQYSQVAKPMVSKQSNGANQPIDQKPIDQKPIDQRPIIDEYANALKEAHALIPSLPDSREKVYAIIRWITLNQLTQATSATNTDFTNRCLYHSAASTVIDQLQDAVFIAQRIADPQAEAWAIGQLGHEYECRQTYDRALALTQQATLIAPTPASRYLWEWQTGRILRAQGKRQEAMIAYQAAVQTLNTLRNDFASAGRDFQFDFRDTVEPVYRELVTLQLEQAIASQPANQNRASINLDQHKTKNHNQRTIETAQSSNPLLVSALKTIDQLRLAELQNYLGSDCTLEPAARSVSLIDARAAILSTMILGDRVAVILTLPGQGRILARWLPVKTSIVTELVHQLRLKLEQRSDVTHAYQEPAQTLYDWLIRPFAVDLQASGVQTLVFIQDGMLRSVPMSALHDGKQFLVEQYAIANTLSLTLVDPSPLDRRSLRVLAFGLTQPAVVAGPTYFEPLSQVETEIQSILTTIEGSKGLLDTDFTPERVQQEITQTPYPVLHLATHGKFGIDGRETFLVTGQTRSHPHLSDRNTPPYNAILSLNQLYQMIRSLPRRQALELLTLTACETATGSDRDALGIAGIALQAGARSAIASLWQVDDRATAMLITRFYQNLQQGMGRATALQQAQKDWLRQYADERHPGYWAAMILVGNWL